MWVIGNGTPTGTGTISDEKPAHRTDICDGKEFPFRTAHGRPP